MKKRYVLGLLLFVASILIKGATIFLAPVFIWCLFGLMRRSRFPELKKPQFRESRISPDVLWQQVWYWASVAMYVIFFLSPIREEIYAWYFIWPLTFLALVDKSTLLHAVSYGFSFGLMLRIVPFFYTRSWSGMTPLVKKIVTFVPPAISALFYGKTRHR